MGGKEVIYVKLLKALYGTLQAAPLILERTTLLKEWGFVLNPYDECVANKATQRKAVYHTMACG
jgi:hypothetical protein